MSMLAMQAYALENISDIEIYQSSEKLGIVFMGDTGSINLHKDKVASAIEKFCETETCDIGLLLGDNFYENGVVNINDPQFKTKFEEPYKNLKFRFYPVLGNHDIRGNAQAQVDYISKHWLMRGEFYSINTKLVNIFALNTNLYQLKQFVKNYSKSITQHTWIKKELANSNNTWKIVYGHHPVYSNGAHGNTKSLILFINPLLLNNKVDFYLSGHDHDKELIEKDGIKYIVLGTGSQLRNIKKTSEAAFSKSSFGFGHLFLTENFAVLKFVDENGVVEFEKKYSK